MANEQIKKELAIALQEQHFSIGGFNCPLIYWEAKADFIMHNLPLEFVKSFLRAHNHAKRMTEKLEKMLDALH